MSDFLPVDPSIIAPELIATPQCAKKQQDEIDREKFEREMEKQRVRKTDADQKKQRKQSHEETEGIEKILTEAHESASPEKPSLYALQTPKTSPRPFAKKEAPATAPKANFFFPSSKNSSASDHEFQLNIPENLYAVEAKASFEYTPSDTEKPIKDPVTPFDLSEEPEWQDPGFSSIEIEQQVPTNIDFISLESIYIPEKKQADLKDPPLDVPEKKQADLKENALDVPEKKQAEPKEKILNTPEKNQVALKEKALDTPEKNQVALKEKALDTPKDPLLKMANPEKQPVLPLEKKKSSTDFETIPPKSNPTSPPPIKESPPIRKPSSAKAVPPPTVHPKVIKNTISKDPLTSFTKESTETDILQPTPMSIAAKEAEILTQISSPVVPQLPNKQESKKTEKQKDHFSNDEESSIESSDLLHNPICAIEPESEGRKRKKKEEEKENLSLISERIFSRPFLPPISEIHAPEPNLSRLSPAIFELFERMVGVIILLPKMKGESKTTINLNQPQFASSVFFGSQITIVECDSAPGEYNIHFFGSEEAKNLFDEHKESLEYSFAKGFEKKEFSFEVKQISSSLLATPAKAVKPVTRKGESP